MVIDIAGRGDLVSVPEGFTGLRIGQCQRFSFRSTIGCQGVPGGAGAAVRAAKAVYSSAQEDRPISTPMLSKATAVSAMTGTMGSAFLRSLISFPFRGWSCGWVVVRTGGVRGSGSG